ncbi:MAG TPA: hypothetical protein VFV87_14310 [Pirellulaceae bacterium]|nr:hypothetical protein [Pirellulaceae bacterium]
MAPQDHPICHGICAAMEAEPKKGVGSLVLKLIDLFKVNMDSLRTIFPGEDAIVAFAKEQFDKYIRPIRVLPSFVGEAAEKAFDDGVWWAVEQAIRALVPG